MKKYQLFFLPKSETVPCGEILFDGESWWGWGHGALELLILAGNRGLDEGFGEEPVLKEILARYSRGFYRAWDKIDDDNTDGADVRVLTDGRVAVLTDKGAGYVEVARVGCGCQFRITAL